MELKVNEKIETYISSESRGFLIWKVYWVYIGRGLNNMIFRGIFQYVLKLRVLFNIQ